MKTDPGMDGGMDTDMAPETDPGMVTVTGMDPDTLRDTDPDMNTDMDPVFVPGSVMVPGIDSVQVQGTGIVPWSDSHKSQLA